MLEATVVMQSTLIFKYKFTDETVINDPRFDKNRYVAHFQVSLGESTCKDAGAAELLRRGAIYNYMFINRKVAPLHLGFLRTIPRGLALALGY